MLFANTMFRAVCYRPDESQVITTGTDRKIGYWETYDGSQIRELDGSQSDSINGMDICGKYFVTGGGDKLIKAGNPPPITTCTHTTHTHNTYTHTHTHYPPPGLAL